MKVVFLQNLPETPASHEDPDRPGTLKRILFSRKDLIKGRVQMINWARLLPKRSFRAHYHEDMEEAFIVITGKAKMYIEKKSVILQKGDAVVVPIAAKHWMENVGVGDVEYVTIGITQERGGRTITVMQK